MSSRITSNGFVSHFDRLGFASPVAASDCIYRKREAAGSARVIRVLDETGRQMGCIALSE
jgi:hypothetical protein